MPKRLFDLILRPRRGPGAAGDRGDADEKARRGDDEKAADRG